MIIVSSGFPKSASTLLFLYTEEILRQSGIRSAQTNFRKKYPEGFINRFGFLNTSYLLFLNLFSGSVVVKTHSGPDFFLRMLIRMKIAKVYYSVRDPRDVILSALDHSSKARTKGAQTPADKSFAIYMTKEDLYTPLKMHFSRYLAWNAFGAYLEVRYENLLTNPENELKKVLQFLGLNQFEKLLPEIVDSFARKKSETKNFNKGELSRFEKEFSSDEIIQIENEINFMISGMGYQLKSTK